MSTYTFVARDATGTRREGTLAANSANEVLESLHQQLLTPIAVQETVTANAPRRPSTRRGRVKTADLSAMCWQLSTMVEGGITITAALDIIAEDTENLHLRDIMRRMLANVREGRLLSDGLKDYPQIFNPLSLAIVVAGETSGNLGQALRTLAEYFDNRDRLARKIRGALAYPVFVLVMITLIVTAIMTLIVPRFEVIFKQLGGRLPAFTQAFLQLYTGLRYNLPYLVGAVVLGMGGAVLLARTKAGHRFVSQVVLHLPLVGKLTAGAFISTFCRTIAVLLDAGVPVLDAFEIIRGMTNNTVIAEAVAGVKQHVTGGASVATGMAAVGFFPHMVVKMAQVGEESGALSGILRRTSEHYERKVTSVIDTMMSLLEPIMISTIGAIVLVVVIALYLPIFTMSDIGH